MTIKVVVFDFDGTLIASNQLKYEAFFDLFPDTSHYRRTIRSVLADMSGESRYAVLDTLLRRFGETREADRTARCHELADRYNDKVQAGAIACPEMRNAEAALSDLSRHHALYISSTTPDAPLKTIVTARGWKGYFRGIFGYPHEKPRTLQRIMQMENAGPHETVVVGDGPSDRKSAAVNGCAFVHVTDDFDLAELPVHISGRQA